MRTSPRIVELIERLFTARDCPYRAKWPLLPLRPFARMSAADHQARS